MGRISLVVLGLLAVLLGCGQSKTTERAMNWARPNTSDYTQKPFNPDSSLNDKVYLHNPYLTELTLGNIMLIIDADKALPDAFFKNKNGDEYLQVVVFPGNEMNSISQVTVGYSPEAPKSENYRPLDIDSFRTESGINLGISLNELQAIKGNNYISQEDRNYDLLTYKITIEDSNFLERYNMPVYVARYWFKDQKLVKYMFGFEYP